MKMEYGSFGGDDMYDRIKYANQYNKSHYCAIKIFVALGSKETLQQMADDHGKSMTAFVLDAVRTKYAGEWDALDADITGKTSG